jgi:sporulation protein YlmC with PRC-barrel domain
MHVEARDGRVGRLDELVLDPDSGVITNLLMRRGHLWGTREIAVPIGQVDFVDGSTVYLKIDRTSVGALPAAKIQRK